MKILFVTNTKKPADPIADASTRYRSWYRVEDLRGLGHKAYLTSIERLQLNVLSGFDFVIFQRPSYSKKLGKCIKQLEQHSIGFAADFDDLVFDPDNWGESPAYLCGRISKEAVIKAHEAYQRALRCFNLVMVSTEPLAANVKRCHPDAQIFTIRNGLGTSWLANKPSMDHDALPRPSISYFSGNYSHDHDFSMVSDSIAAYMSQHVDVELHIYGYLNFDKDKFNKSRITVHPYSHYSRLPGLIEKHTITISPLIANQFNDCKSAVKFLEASSQGVPCVSTELEDMQRFKHPGLVVATADNWYSALEEAMSIGRKVNEREGLLNYSAMHCSSVAETWKLLAAIDGQLTSKPRDNSQINIGQREVDCYIEPSNAVIDPEIEASEESWMWVARRRFRKLKRDPVGFARASRLNPINVISRLRTYFS